MSDIAILREMIKETAIVALEGGKVTLQEPEHSDCSITIHGMPDEDEVIVIKADKFQSPDTVFKGEHGECKRADFIVVAETKKVVICIELKKRKDKERDIINQLKGSQCFVYYCQKVGALFWEETRFLTGYQYRFVSICHTSIPKKKTRIDRSQGIHDRPDKMLKISSPHRLEFNHLARSGTRR